MIGVVLKKKKLDFDKISYSLGSERFLVPELFFETMEHLHEPDVLPSISNFISTSIMNCDVDIRDELFHNIYLVGGTTQLPGLDKRIEAELNNLVEGVPIKVHQVKDGANSSWKGAAYFATTPNFTKLQLTIDNYHNGKRLYI